MSMFVGGLIARIDFTEVGYQNSMQGFSGYVVWHEKYQSEI